jgi:uncharacterized protein (DUF1015 family)
VPRLTPFRGLRYTPAAGSFGTLLAPPYDVISEQQRRSLEHESPHNAVHLELAEGPNPYEQVRDRLHSWIASGVIRRDERPMLYVYEQEFIEAGETYKRRALLCGVEAQPWEDGAIKPHEYTMEGPKEDRLNLLRATKTQFSPIFMIARDRAGQLREFLDMTCSSGAAVAEGETPDGGWHRLWVQEADRMNMRMLAPLLSESFYIADGHHRYETAVNYRDELNGGPVRLAQDHPARFAMCTVVPAEDPGLVIRPGHRMVPRPVPEDWKERLTGTFGISSIETVDRQGPEQAEYLIERLADADGSIIAVGIEAGRAFELRPSDLSAVIAAAPNQTEEWVTCAPNLLRYGVLTPLWGINDEDLVAGAVDYTYDHNLAVDFAEGEDARTTFLIHHVPVETVMSLADGDERLPQKSTFFYPKVATGLVFHPLET